MINNPDPYQIEPTTDQIRRRAYDEGLASRNEYFNVWEAVLAEEWQDDPVCYPVRHCSEFDENDPEATR